MMETQPDKMYGLEQLLNQHPIIAVVLVLGLAYLIRVGYAMRQGLPWVLQAFLVAFVAMLIATAIAQATAVQGQNADLIGGAVAAGASAMYPKQTRYSPATVTRA